MIRRKFTQYIRRFLFMGHRSSKSFKKIGFFILLWGVLLLGCAKKNNPIVSLETSKGVITLELFINEAPETVDNFLKYVNDKFYEGTIFHRVIADFVIQGGGFNSDMKQTVTDKPIQNEAANGQKNQRGTIAMARTSDIHSATSQFFINLKDNENLDHRDNTTSGFGYCVFGKVIEGMDVVDAIAATPTHITGGFRDVPMEDVILLSVKVTGEKKN